MDVELKQLERMRLATLRHIGPYSRISEAFARLRSIAGPAGLLRPDTLMLAVFHDDPETTAAAQLRSDAAIIVAPEVPIPEGLTEQHLPSGRYACTTHVGPYEELGRAWSKLMGEWLPKSGHRMKGDVSFELYRNTPEDVSKDKLVTELFVLVES